MNTIYFTLYENRPEHFWSYELCWKSLLFVGPKNCRLLVASAGASQQLLDRIPPGLEIRHTSMPHTGIHEGNSADLVKWDTSREGDREDQVLFLDSRDMIFQRDPFDDISGYGLVASGEGVAHQRSEFNTIDHMSMRQHLPPALWEDFSQWPVVCEGVIGGRRLAARCALMSIWLMSSTFLHGGTNQGAWNYIWNKHLQYEAGSWLCDPGKSDWCLSGHHAEDINPKPYWFDGKIYSGLTNRPYAIIHQWDRTQWRNDLIKSCS